MSLQLAAKHLAAQGRGPDKNLVHMSPREVAGLQALAMASGGSLSVNPQTGLYEAGFLDKMLPMLIGVGITAATGGAAAPWMVGLGMGGFEAARTGDLSKGLMAGLGAYGGAGLGAGLMGAGAAGAANSAGAMADVGMGAPGFGANVSQMGQGLGALGSEAGRSGFMGGVGGMKGLMASGAAGAAPMMLEQPKFTPPPVDSERYNYSFDLGRTEDPEAGYTGPTSGERDFFNQRFTRMAEGGPIEQMSANNVYDMQNARGGVSDMGIDNATGMERMAEGGSANDYSGNAYAFAPVAQVPPPANRRRGAAAPVENPEVRTQLDNLERQELINQGYRGEDALPTANRSMPVEQPYVPPVAGGDYTYVYDPETQTYKNIAPPVTAAPAQPEAVVDPYAGVSYGFAGGGITDLGGYSDGGRLLRGPGDGVSDSIPAMIGQKQPARLADGEFVVPARIVSELGNGSTEAGARKLYAMMDRVQSARRKTVGKNKVANNPRADKYLPA